MNPDISPILEALNRRRMGGVGGGAPIQAAQQITRPTGSPMGGSGAVTPPVPQMPNMQGQDVTNQFPGGNQAPAQAQPRNQAAQAGQLAQGPQFDDETRKLAKSLVERLIKGM